MAEANPARVIIVDPEPFFHEKMRACLSKSNYVVVGEAPNPEIAVQQLNALYPELVVVGPTLKSMYLLRSAEKSLAVCQALKSLSLRRTGRIYFFKWMPLMLASRLVYRER